MSRLDDLRRLIAEIEQSRKSGGEADLSPPWLDLLREALDGAAHDLVGEDQAPSRRYRVFTVDTENGDETLIGSTDGREIAEAIFRAALRRHSGKHVRLYDSQHLIGET